MSTITDRHEPFPVAPPSTSAGGHEMRDGSAAQEAPRPFIQSSSSYPTPYLGLKSRLSQVWINRWTVLLLLVLVRTLFAIASLDDNLGTARAKALSACTSVENVGSGLASMPHYLAGGVNQLSADGIEKAVNGLMKGLTLTVTGVEEIAVFYVNTLIGTYVCLVTFAVTGGLHVAVDVAEDVGNALNATAKAVGSDLSKGTQDLQNALNGFISDIEKVGSFFTGKSPTPPTVDFSSEISSLNGLQLPAGYDQGLAKLNASIPTFAEVKNLTNTAIRFPFEEVKKLLNESLPTYSLDRTLFPVPQKEQLTFCSDNNGINDFFDDLIRIEHLAKKIFIAVLVALAVLVCAPMAYREIRRWRLQQERIRFANAEAVDDIDAAYIVSRPYTASAGLALSRKFHSARAKAMVRFTVAYATTVPALFVLSLALAGLLACLCQYILLKAIEKEVPQLTAEVGAFADQVLNKLNNASEQWAIGTNNIINSTNSKINHDVFGWVNTTTTAVNNTLNLFVDGMMDGLNATFGGTPLYDPVLEVLNCLILLKVQGIEKALTWVSDNAYITFPELPVDTFSLGAMDKMSEGGNSSILATGPTDEASDAISGAVLDVMNHLQNAIRQEALISTSILVVWLIIVLIGLLQSAWFLTKRGDAPPTRPITPDGGAPGFFAPSSKVPTYEQATSEKHLPDGNTYNGQAYTLTPNPIPTFRIDQPNSPILTSGQANDEKVGTVGATNVESVTHRPQNTRSSSYGNFAVTTPIDPPYSSKNHFLNGSSRDPSSDPRR